MEEVEKENNAEISVPETVDVPVLEVEFDKFIEISEKINLVDSLSLISMANHVKDYSNREKYPIVDLVNELLECQKEENNWRISNHTVVEYQNNENKIQFLDKTICDAGRIIIISKMNTVFIVPGEKSIKEGNCQPNQIIKLTNLISSQLFLMKFRDIKQEDGDGFDLRVEYALISKKSEANDAKN